MAYTTQSKVEQYLKTDLSEVSSEVTNWIAAVEAYINNYVGSAFGTRSQTRYYDVDEDSYALSVDPFNGDPTSINILDDDGTITETVNVTDVVSYPLNEAWHTQLYRTDSLFTYGKKRVKLVANFVLDDEVPQDIQMAATMMVADLAEKRQGGVAQSETLGDYSVSYKDIDASKISLDAVKILDYYRTSFL